MQSKRVSAGLGGGVRDCRAVGEGLSQRVSTGQGGRVNGIV